MAAQEPFSHLPSEAEGKRLLAALRQRDPAAPVDFALAFLPGLTAWLRCECCRAPAETCDAAAVEAIYGLLSQPDGFAEEGGKTLNGYLKMAARGDLINLLEREGRHAHVPLDENVVELAGGDRNTSRELDEPWQVLAGQEDQQTRDRYFGELEQDLSEPDRQVLTLLRQGERSTPAFAEVLGISGCSPEEQQAEVKRAKDRIKLRLRRKGPP